jgi:1-acyl-sn-glycerol-3-phosphate acyltransferase
VKRLPLADELPYQFYPPRIEPFWLWVGRWMLPRMLRQQLRIETIDITGTEHLEPLLKRGDGVLLAPNHCDNADCYMMFELGQRLGMPFFYMAAYQLFTGRARWVLPRIGVFPVDREGADLTAFKTGVDVLAKGRHPLVIFPEGEVYHLVDRLTPLREGAVAVATTAVKRLDDPAKTVWIVPVALKYRFLEHADPLPSLHAVMERLEERFTWWPRHERDLDERIYEYATGVLGLKEYEYLGQVQTGPLRDRLVNLATQILDRIEERRLGRRQTDTIPCRVKELRHVCLEVLADRSISPAARDQARRDLHDVFTAIQLFSYPGDYVRESPTLERIAETLTKFEQDFLGKGDVVPHAPRRAVMRLGEPIDVRSRMAGAGKPRHAVAAVTTELERRMQGLLDAIGPGRPLPRRQPAENGQLRDAR